MAVSIKLSGKYLDSVASDPTLDHIQTIRIGSKSLAYWPYKYVTDDDADDLMVSKRALFITVCIKTTITLPRQARDKTNTYRESTLKRRTLSVYLSRRCSSAWSSPASTSASWRTSLTRLSSGKERPFLRCHFILKMIILPRQARDKHRESSTQKRDARFLAAHRL
eukprot:COSAG06_NODE_3330_length_5494_cov_6.154402_6_plen_166_part_00